MIRRITTASGFSIPALGMGTWCFGGRTEHDPANDDNAQIAALQTGLEAGFTLIDTAEYYAAGYAELLTGKAIRSAKRENLFLTSKVWKTHLKHDQVIEAAENSLRRLGTDYLDLYLYHQVSDEVPLEETLGAMDELADRGLVRYIGVSNFGVSRLKKAMELSRHPIAVNQVHYNLGVRDAEEELLPFCQIHDVILQAWRPMRDLTPTPLTDELCAKYQVTFAQLAVAFLLNQPGVGTITAMKNPAHIRENLAAADLKLDTADLERLKKEYPRRAKGADVKLN